MKIKKMKLFSKSEIALILVIIFLEIIMFGMAGNFKAIQNNGGKMPVEIDEYYVSDTHFSFQNRSEISHYYLVDIYYVHSSIYSIGDLIMYFGAAGSLLFLWLFARLKFFERKKKKQLEKRRKKKCKSKHT